MTERLIGCKCCEHIKMELFDMLIECRICDCGSCSDTFCHSCYVESIDRTLIKQNLKFICTAHCKIH